MMLRKTLMSVLALGVLAAVPAFAEGVPSNMGPGSGGAPEGAGTPKMERKNPADTDGDGFLSKAEFQTVQDKRFAEMDSNSDGKISKEEMKSHRESKKAEWQSKRKEWKEKHGDDKGHEGPGHDGPDGDEQPPVE